jgi:amino acid transporter
MTQNNSTALPTNERLTGSLGFIGTLAQPLGVQAPTASAFIVPAVMAGYVGLATPLAFVLGVGIGLFVAYSFCLFARKYATAGSIYGFNRTALGPGYAFSSAWILLCAYLAFAAAIGPIIANYMNSLWPAYGNAIPWEVTSVVVMLLAGLLVFRSVELSAKVTATFESIGLICLLAICIAVLANGGYGGHSITLKPFGANGLSFSSLAFGVAFAFVGFAGFESAAVLGEESRNPTRAIPRAIITGLLIGGGFVTLAAYVEIIGFPSPAALAQDPAPLVTLAHNFIGGSIIGKVITVAVILTSFGSAIGLLQAASRLLYSFSRDGIFTRRLAHTHPLHGTPVNSLGVVWVLTTLAALCFIGRNPVTPFAYLSTTGAIAIVIAYLSTVVAAAVRFRNTLHVVVPTVGIPLLCYVLYRNVIPIPPSPLDWYIYLAFAWLGIGIAAVLASKKLRRLLAESRELTLMTTAAVSPDGGRCGQVSEPPLASTARETVRL